MNKITAITRVNENSNTKYSRDFQIMDKLPEVGDFIDTIDYEVIEIKKADVDTVELAHNSAADGYSFYEIVADYKPEMDEEDYEPSIYYVAVKED